MLSPSPVALITIYILNPPSLSLWPYLLPGAPESCPSSYFTTPLGYLLGISNFNSYFHSPNLLFFHVSLFSATDTHLLLHWPESHPKLISFHHIQPIINSCQLYCHNVSRIQWNLTDSFVTIQVQANIISPPVFCNILLTGLSSSILALAQFIHYMESKMTFFNW